MHRVNPDDYEAAARDVLPDMVYDYYAGGSEDERTLAANRSAWETYRIVPRVLVPAGRIDTSVELLGSRLAFPVLTAPCAFNRLAHVDGELAVARAAARAGVIQILSTASTTSLEEVAGAVSGVAPWFQLYCYRDREVTLELVRRAEAAGFGALCLTVDVPVPGLRERDVRNRFRLPPGITWANMDHIMDAEVDGSALTRYIHDMWDPDLGWDVVEWLAAEARIPLVIKGVLSPADASRAAELHLAGIVVSNHGGRQLDGAVSTAEVLGDVARAVDGRCAVLVDGGIRRGSHVVKALALGADAVLVGRPYLWGLAVDGEAGVDDVLETLRTGTERAMALAGCQTVADCRQLELRSG